MGVLSEFDQGIWSDHAQALIDDYCCWPDLWFNADRFDEIDLYQLCIDGKQFHYPPISHVHEQYLYWRAGPNGLQPVDSGPNANWQFMHRGITHYLTTIREDIAANRPGDAAKRLGILLHAMQDTHILHALEGPEGTDCFIFNRLMPIPEGDTYRTPTSYLLGLGPTKADIADHTPKLEGSSIAEAALRIYARYAQSAHANRRLHLPIIQARMADDDNEARRLYGLTNDTLAKLTADVLHTATAIATQQFDPEELRTLDETYLHHLHPIYRPRLSSASMYSWETMVPGVSLDGEYRKHPLRVRVGQDIHETTQGFSGGGHLHGHVTRYELPADVYTSLTGMIGLHEPLGRGGDVDLTITCDDKLLMEQRISDDHPTAMIDLPMAAGGMLQFRIQDRAADSDRNNLAWCDLKLVK